MTEKSSSQSSQDIFPVQKLPQFAELPIEDDDKTAYEGIYGFPARTLARGKRQAEMTGKREDEEQVAGSSITVHDIEELIASASMQAEVAQGSGQAARGDDSQKFHRDLRECVRTWRAGRSDEPTVASLGTLITMVLKLCYAPHCRPQPKASKDSMFPLFAPGPLVDAGPKDEFLQALLACLNHLHGVESSGRGSPTSRTSKRLAGVVKCSGILDEVLGLGSFKDFFSTHQLDYSGDEIQVARPVVWESVEASLPKEVGQLDITDYCEGGVLHYIQHFQDYLVPECEMKIGKPPKVMVDSKDWETVAAGLVSRGLCRVLRKSELFHVGQTPLLNGLFSVSKNEMVGTTLVTRLIMNLKPLNSLCRSMVGDTLTLPSVTSLGSIFLDSQEALCISSEDIRCFFYLFKVPWDWHRFLGFARVAPRSVTPAEFGDEEGYLAATVLPMGFINSVSIAQHIHRLVVRRCAGQLHPPLGGECELRRDRPCSTSAHTFRVYLDNFDELRKISRTAAEILEGTPSQLALALREEYEVRGLPRHPKKSTQQQLQAEVQGAWVDGVQGTVSAKPVKVAKYLGLALELLGRGFASQRELQVVGGGFVYISMFRRPLLCALNQIWRCIVEMEPLGPYQRKPLRKEVACELVRFMGLVPLAFMNLRLSYDEVVTASDASSTGGGVCASRGLSPYGLVASTSMVRGDLPEEHEFEQILSVGLFDGLGALRVALDALGLPLAGHVSVERSPEARRVVESFFPEVIGVDDVAEVGQEFVKGLAMRFPSVGVVVVGAGPPCQGVSGLNVDRKGAMKDERSVLFHHFPRIMALCREAFPWAQVQGLMESVGSMDPQDCCAMNQGVQLEPWYIDAAGVSLCHRPRLYWVTWELMAGEGVQIGYGSEGQLPIQGEVKLDAQVEEKAYLEPGWARAEGRPLPTFTTARPSPTPLKRPAGLKGCQDHELARWKDDLHRFPPYQYKDCNCVKNSKGEIRIPNIVEREVILGFPAGYTSQCMKKGYHNTVQHSDCRLTLLGNTWSVPVICWLLANLFHVLGFMAKWTPQDIVNRLKPGNGASLQSILLRPPIKMSTSSYPSSRVLVRKLCGLVSLKGEDIMLQSHGENTAGFQRLRASVPAKLWRWKTIASWQWGGTPEHINVLELRAALTTIKHRVEQRKQSEVKCIHLVDSLVVLHALTRGRSSSRKMRRTIMRLNSYLLASGLQPCWGYVDTHQNPADRPSRRRVKKKWVKGV